MRIRVDLPEPEVPTTTVMEPLVTVISTPSTTVALPYCFVTSRSSIITSSFGAVEFMRGGPGWCR